MTKPSTMDVTFSKKKCVLLMMPMMLLCVLGDTGNKPCTNSDGVVIPHGSDFIPDFNDACKICTCDNGYPILCRTAACSPPPGCQQTKPIPRQCCQFVCQGGDLDKNGLPPSVDLNNTLDGKTTKTDDNITNLSLRLVASTVTSFLVLALLLFMVHRLRQRRLMLAMRRFEAQARQQRGDEDDVDHYIPAAFLHIECPPYEDPPPPYSPPKPPHILPEDSPPPYQEVENSPPLPRLDANANNNRSSNPPTVQCHQQESNSAAPHPFEGDTAGEGGNSRNANIVDIMDAFSGGAANIGSEDASCHSAASGRRTSAHVNGSDQGRDENTEMKILFPREFASLEGSSLPLHGREYSLFSAARAPEDGSTSSGSVMLPKETAGHGFPAKDVAVSRELKQRNSDSHPGGGVGKGGGGRGARRTGRSCSFSFAPPPTHAEEDISLSGIALAPMAHSYHAATASTTADSGVQTRGSYTASLSRHRARAGEGGEQGKQPLKEEGGAGGKRMVTKPMTKCDASVQHSHRLLQEELKRNLPPTCVSVGESSSQSQRQGSDAAGLGSEGGKAVGSGKTVGNSDGNQVSVTSGCALPNGSSPIISMSSSMSQCPDGGGGMGVGATLSSMPRSQSVTSALSVCSETGETRLKKALAEAERDVLPSDSQYPRLASPPRNLQSNSEHHHVLDLATGENSSSMPNYASSFSSNSPNSVPSGTGNSSGGGVRSEGPGNRTKAASGFPTRRAVPNPPSQELRTGSSAPNGGHPHTTKSKHRKIHFVPLEKSKTFKSKEKKSKGSSASGGKKGEAEQLRARLQDSSPAGGARPSSFSHPHAISPSSSSATQQETGEFRSPHQPKLADVIRSRSSSSKPSVKQYGFLDNFPSHPPSPLAAEEAPRCESAGKSASALAAKDFSHGVEGGILASPPSIPYHPRPAPPYQRNPTTVANTAPQQPANNHRRQQFHGEKPALHAYNLAALRPKVKARPLSGGLVVEPGRDPADPVAALPQNSVGRRRVKTLHAKKSRQSFPNPDSGGGSAALVNSERKLACMDMGFVEPCRDVGRTGGGGGAGDPVPARGGLFAKRPAAADKACDKAGLKSTVPAPPPVLELEGHMSSYV